MPTGDIELPKDKPPPLATSRQSVDPDQLAAALTQLLQGPAPPSTEPPPRRPYNPLAAMSKATSIGPGGIGAHNVPPTFNELLASDNPAQGIVEHLLGPSRTREVQRQDPFGVEAFLQGKGPMPMMGGATEEVGNAAKNLVGDAAQEGIRAFHGSPYDIDKFDLGKIGTGQGAQTYGHGLYFGGAEPTAEHYRATLSGRPDVTVGGDVVPIAAGLQSSSSPEAIVAARVANKFHQHQQTISRKLPLEDVLQHVDAELEQGLYRAREQKDFNLYQSLSDQRLALQRFREQGIGLTRPGHTYEVNLRVDPKTLLDWDAPIHEQPHVVDALRQVGFKNFEPTYRQPLIGGIPDPGGLQHADYPDLRLGPYFSGNRAYETLADALYKKQNAWMTEPEAAQLASQHLRDAGVPGIKYLDQFSRQGAGNTSNYVMFRDDLIDILRKYGILLPAAGLGGAAAGASQGAPARREFQPGK